MAIKLQFDSSQEYQLTAIRSVVDIFEGHPLASGAFDLSFTVEGSSLAFTEKGFGNRLVLNEAQIFQNIRSVQERNGIALSESLERCRYVKNQETGEIDFIPLNFTVEMETGTGKTYAYLRTIYELNKVYGFKKFVIVVPSVAIREGTVKNLKITHDHFQDLYGKPPLNFMMYESRNFAALRNFATSNAIQILVMNIDSFTKDTNVINTRRETGVKPIEYLQATCPFVIVDEPQNMETDVRRAALHNLNPLCTLRYSATHRNLYNLVYSLNPVQAYDLGLVKQIEVVGVTAIEQDYNQPYVRYEGCKRGKRSVTIKLTLNARTPQGIRRQSVSISPGKADLFVLSGFNPLYKDIYIVHWSYLEDEQNSEIEISNGWKLREKCEIGGQKEEMLKYQIEMTVKEHFQKSKKLTPKGIKVLSLFFIDRVANYRAWSADGTPQRGKFALWFEEAFLRYANQNQGLIPFPVEMVHNGYFSSDKKGGDKERKEVWIDSKEKNTKDDEDTYSLIMRDKERLLSLDEPLQFVFSHSALREGWDNPNVFQICTLNESRSDLKKRQEIGRGLRLPVDSSGLRVQDKRINVLTVVANETYEDFSQALQREIQEETSVEFQDRIKNARDKAQVRLSKELTLENFPLLFEIWEKIKHQTRYAVEYSTHEVIERTLAELRDFNFVPLTNRPMLEARTARLSYSEEGIEVTLKDRGVKKTEEVRYAIPDVYAYVQSRVDVSRNTVYEIMKQSKRLAELEINPQVFLDNIVSAIRRTLTSLLVEGVKYERINGSYYEMRLFEFEEIETYLSNLFAVSKQDKTVLNYIPIDSEVEGDFAHDCEADENIKFFFKLPRGFKVSTPIGNYVPDWALVFENDRRVYFVAETKGALDRQLLREIERMKVDCGAKHFALFKPLGVEYKLALKVSDLYK